MRGFFFGEGVGEWRWEGVGKWVGMMGFGVVVVKILNEKKRGQGFCQEGI